MPLVFFVWIVFPAAALCIYCWLLERHGNVPTAATVKLWLGVSITLAAIELGAGEASARSLLQVVLSIAGAVGLPLLVAIGGTRLHANRDWAERRMALTAFAYGLPFALVAPVVMVFLSCTLGPCK